MTQIATETIQTDESEVAIAIEVDEDMAQRGWESRDGGRGTIATEAFTKGMDLIRTCAEQVAKTVRAPAAARGAEGYHPWRRIPASCRNDGNGGRTYRQGPVLGRRTDGLPDRAGVSCYTLSPMMRSGPACRQSVHGAASTARRSWPARTA